MTMSLITCNVLLLAVTRFSVYELEYDVRNMTDVDLEMVSPFNKWWSLKCETDWVMGYYLFRTG